MDFHWTKEHQLIKKSARDFGNEQLEPQAAEIDRTGRFPSETVKAMAELDFMGMFFPPEYGGAGTDFMSYILMLEELSRFCASTSAILATHCSLVSYPVFKYGSESQKKKYLTAMCKGEKLGGFALAEPGAAPASGPERVVAIMDGDDYLLNGKKYFVLNGGVADIYVVFAQTGQSAGMKGLSAFIVEAGIPGFKVKRQIEKMGLRAQPTAEMVFEKTRVSRENLLGAENQGYEILKDTLAFAGVAAAAQVAGICQTALELSVKYAKERVQFGRPIACLQAIQWMLADMAANVHMIRLATYKAASLIQEDKTIAYEAAIARMFAARAGVDVCMDAVQIHGGYGYGKELIVERLLRDVKGIIIFENSSEFPQSIIASTLLR
ncbi:acyl-CoA dehydrogenases [Pelotomaculum thermopropionicum SI]|uniref:Acyl-CoA dehydrogenases n=1 Tax=Pelotomaculum thermopropionicum (strain DSM 13744 / JCM 10971 / SI) TaxID=370438 RepID=A5D1Y9_PELTS|nr:acyl-CoA dehydrogenases [Pelotomaculum thermopropionicum SI]